MKVNNLMLIGALTALSGCGQPTDNAQETAARMPKSPPVTSSVEEPGATTGPAQAAAAASDGIAKGKMLFARCRACHSIEQGKNRVGPSLHGIVGRPSASVVGFTYSPEMQAANLTWDETTLSAYIEDPRGFVEGNKMVFAGLKNDQDRIDLIAYFKSLQP